MKLRAFIFSILFMPLVASADCESGKYWCAGVNISQLTVLRTGVVLVQTDGTESNLSCIPTSSAHLMLKDIDNTGKSIFSTLLTAQASKQKVQIVLINTPGLECEIDYIRLPG
jgi:uncharacterized membrane protein YadS